MVSVDGGQAPASRTWQDGNIAATSQQYPLKMADLGVKAIADFVNVRHQAHRRARASTSSTPASP